MHAASGLQTRLKGEVAPPGPRPSNARRGARKRKGTAAVEFALICPLLFSVVFGIIDFGRAVMVIDLLNDVARQGARVGAIAGRANADVSAAVDNALTNSTLPARGSGTVLTVQVNGVTADAGTAISDDQVAVTVSVQVSSVSWLPTQWFISRTASLTGTSVMRRE